MQSILQHRRKAFRSTGNPGTADLLLWLGMEEGTLTSVDDDHAANDFTLSGASWIGSGQGGSSDSLSFDGTNDYLQSDSTINFGTDTVSLVFWAYFDAYTFGGDDDCISELSSNFNSNNHTWFITANGTGGASEKFHVIMKNNSGYWSMKCDRATVATWTHIVIVINTSTSPDIKVYYDGVSQSMTAVNTTTGDGSNFKTDTLNLMARNGASLFDDANLDEFAIFTDELTADEVTWLYNSGSGRQYSDL